MDIQFTRMIWIKYTYTFIENNEPFLSFVILYVEISIVGYRICIHKFDNDILFSFNLWYNYYDTNYCFSLWQHIFF